jgi:hypothetical protein
MNDKNNSHADTDGMFFCLLILKLFYLLVTHSKRDELNYMFPFLMILIPENEI